MILGSGLIQAAGPSFGTVAADSSDSSLFSGYTPNVATVGPVSRRLYFGKSGGTWRTLWTDTSGALLRGDGAGTYAVTKASDGPAPFDTDDGLATDTHSGSVASGTTFVHEADMLLEITVATLTITNMSFSFRQASDTNRWFAYIVNNGDFYLFETVDGVSTPRAFAAGAIASGDRVVIVAEGSTIRGYSKNVLRWTYASATSHAAATTGKFLSVGNGGVFSDLKTWPRTLSGTAASILNKASG